MQRKIWPRGKKTNIGECRLEDILCRTMRGEGRKRVWRVDGAKKVKEKKREVNTGKSIAKKYGLWAGVPDWSGIGGLAARNPAETKFPKSRGRMGRKGIRR